MSKKVNIMADVDQTVYDAVVVPHKQSRTFTSLIETLLNGYYSNAYIRSFVDDELDGIQHESTDVLNDIISNMHKGLANMGVYTEEMKSNSQDGIDAFSQKSEETKKEMEDIQAQEIRALKEGMDDLREQVRSQNDEILGMLKALMSGSGSGVTEVKLERSKEEFFDPVHLSADEDEVLVDLSEDGSSSHVKAVGGITKYTGAAEESESESVSESEENTTSEEEANEIMANLLIGQEYSF